MALLSGEKTNSTSAPVSACSSDKVTSVSCGNDKDLPEQSGNGVAAGVARASALSLRGFLTKLIVNSFRAPIRWFRPHRGIGTWDLVALRNPNSKSTLHAIRQEFSRSGFSGLTKQVLSPMAVNAIIGSVMFSVYGCILEWLSRSRARDNKLNVGHDPKHYFLAGGISGTVQGILSCPVSQVRLHMKHSRHSLTLWRSCLHLTQTEGVYSLFHSVSSHMLKEGLGIAIFFTTYECSKRGAEQVLAQVISDYPCTRRVLSIMLGGGLAGMSYQLINHPFVNILMHYELEIHKMQSSSPRIRGKAESRSPFRVFAKTVPAKNWPRVLTAGVGDSLKRVIGPSVFALVIFEYWQ